MRDDNIPPTASAAPTTAATPSLLQSADEVATDLDCCRRHVIRLSEAGSFPKPLKLGRLLRWRRVDVESFVAGTWKRGGR